MNDEKICPLLSISANHAEDGMQHCRSEKCAWYCRDRSMCSLEALALNTDHIETGLERASDALDCIQCDTETISNK